MELQLLAAAADVAALASGGAGFAGAGVLAIGYPGRGNATVDGGGRDGHGGRSSRLAMAEAARAAVDWLVHETAGTGGGGEGAGRGAVVVYGQGLIGGAVAAETAVAVDAAALLLHGSPPSGASLVSWLLPLAGPALAAVDISGGGRLDIAGSLLAAAAAARPVPTLGLHDYQDADVDVDLAAEGQQGLVARLGLVPVTAENAAFAGVPAPPSPPAGGRAVPMTRSAQLAAQHAGQAAVGLRQWFVLRPDLAHTTRYACWQPVLPCACLAAMPV
eukprot:SAG22_NODE_431_length_10572_cov_70.070467_2_plen_274_part_00